MSLQDGPSNSNFSPVPLKGNTTFEELGNAGLSEAMTKALSQAPRGDAIAWGIPFRIDRPILLKDGPVTEPVQNLKAEWLVFCHTADVKPLERDSRGFIRPMRGEGHLGEHIADYTIVYADGTEVRSEIRRRHHVGTFRRIWGENCFQAVAHRKPHPVRTVREQPSMLVDAGGRGWGNAETRVVTADSGRWVNWLWAWKNPHPGEGDRRAPVRAEVRRDDSLRRLGWQRDVGTASMADAAQSDSEVAGRRHVRLQGGRPGTLAPDPTRHGPGDFRRAAADLSQRRVGRHVQQQSPRGLGARSADRVLRSSGCPVSSGGRQPHRRFRTARRSGRARWLV